MQKYSIAVFLIVDKNDCTDRINYLCDLYVHKIPYNTSDLWKSASAANGGLKVAYINFITQIIYFALNTNINLNIHVKNPKQKGRVTFAYFWFPKLALHSLSTELANLELAN